MFESVEEFRPSTQGIRRRPSTAKLRENFMAKPLPHLLLLSALASSSIVQCAPLLTPSQWCDGCPHLPEWLITPEDVFVSGQEGYPWYRIPALVRLPSGGIGAFTEGRKTGTDIGVSLL